MSEQEYEEKEEETAEVEKKKDGRKDNSKKAKLFARPEFRDKLREVYEEAGGSATATAKEIGYLYETTITPQTVLNIIKKETIKHRLSNPKEADDVSRKYENILRMRYDRIAKIADFMLDTIEKIRDEFDASDMETMQKYIAFMRLAPQINMTLKTVLEQLKFIQEEQERIKVEQKNFIYSPIQINNEVHKLIKNYQNAGIIKVIRPDKLNEDGIGGRGWSKEDKDMESKI